MRAASKTTGRCCTKLEPIDAPTSSHGCCTDGAPMAACPFSAVEPLLDMQTLSSPLLRRLAPPLPYPGPTYNSILLGVPSSSPATLYSSHPRPSTSLATAPRSFTHIHAQPRSPDTKASSKFPRNPPGHHGIRKGRNVRSPPSPPCSFPLPSPLLSSPLSRSN